MGINNRHSIFSVGKPTLRPRNCGLNFGDLTEDEMLALPYDLTDEEKKSAFSKYFYGYLNTIEIEHEKVLNQPAMDSKEAFMPDMYASFMNNRGYCSVENGYCILRNGIGYVAVKINQNGIMDDMVELFNNEFAPGHNLFYKIWLPNSHLLHYTDGAVENFGWGRVNLRFISSVFMEDLGLDYSQIHLNDPNCININGSSAIIQTIEGPLKGSSDLMTIVNYHRETDEGRECRIRIWYGISIEDGKTVSSISNRGTSQNQARDLMAHLIYEYQNNANLIRQFWKDRQASLI